MKIDRARADCATAGSETFACLMRAMSGPSTQKLALMRETSSYGAVVSEMSRAVRWNVSPR